MAAGENWRSNFPTGFLASIVDRVTPAPIKIIEAARYLTSARLSDKDKDGKERTDVSRKSEEFQRIITKAIRQWSGWKDHNYASFQEDVLLGGAFSVWLDEDEPWPWAGKLNEVFLPEGTGQNATACQLFSAKKSYLIHEAVDFIKDGRDVAEAAGWDVDAMVETINKAAPNNPIKGDNTSSTTDSRSYEDTVREGTQGQSYETGAKVIETYHLLATEPDTGKVTQYIIDRNGENKVLFMKEDRYKNMEECIVLFTLQPGNGKFYGSKGLGRILVNMHIAIERARNVMFDQFYLAGLMILKTDAAKAPQVQLKVKHPFILVTSDADFAKDQLQANVEEFLKLDAKISQLAEMAAGAYIPDAITQAGDTGDKTAEQVRIEASRENEAKIAFLARAWGQKGNEISVMQLRLCKKDSSHPAAKQVYKELEEAGLKEDEIEELANTPASEVVQDLSSVQNQQIGVVAQAYTGNPSIDQQKLLRYAVTAMSTPQIADDLIIPQNDHTIEAEEVRLQILENAAIMSGESVPISPRDKHDIHAKVCLSEIQRSAPGIVKAVQSDPRNSQMLDHINAALIHTQAHVDAMKQGGADPETIKPFQQAIDIADDMLKKFAQELSQQAQEAPTMPQDASQALGVPQVPPQDQNAPEPIHPEEHMLKIASSITYKDAPDSIKSQIEVAAGFVPATPEERAKNQASDAISKHPDLPSKLEPIEQSRVIPTQPIDPSRVIPTQPISPERVIPNE